MKKKGTEPPSLFDNLDLFAQPPEPPDGESGSSEAGNEAAPMESASKPAVEVASSPAETSLKGLTGRGPMRDLYDFNFRQYSAYVICSRAIPAVEDGLKPVQRRIMHSLWEKDDGKYTKVANIVGHAMQYHPHGDASIGDAIVVLANKLWGEGRGYLIDGQGNYGSLYTGMPHAATRYIECRLTDLARREVFNRKTTDFVPNYDGRKEEPVYLPAKIPLLLMLGADGIAVGLSTAILPHNFIELLEAEICLIQKKPFKLYPDFQLGGIMDVSEYQDGTGKVKVRAVIEEADKNKLVITQLPWGETTDSISESIEDAIKKRKVKIRKIHDLTSAEVRIELELQAGESPAKVKSALYAFTNCEKSIASRPIVLDAGRPRAMTVSQILQKNVDRLMFLTKREQEIRLDELDSLFHARTLDRIFVEERIYKRIENEKTYEGVQSAVMEGFKPFRAELRHDITADDVERLLKIPIRRISQFDINKNRDEITNILAEERQVKDNLDHLRAFTVKYLKSLISQYRKKYPRCTKIEESAFQQADVRKLTASELTVRIDRENHYIGTDVRGGDELFKCSSLDEILCLWKDGRFKKIQPPDKFFVDKDIMAIFLFQQEKDRDKEFICVYEEPLYGFAYVKRFTFGGLIRNKEYRLAPPKSKVLHFSQGCPERLYVKFKPAKGQKIHQQMFDPKEVAVRGSSARGIQMTTKPIARCSPTKGSWWDDSEAASKGVLL
ncbi:MAG: DNA topoisomerase IV subunit A [Verrucomicrobiota bacterium]|nr:DNA topoisomerase IV subunit A [Verrucomicrobiota bacterium]MDY5597637.1 DNA topoisomerase IV subunit A [Kiritimatiellia bacterium]